MTLVDRLPGPHATDHVAVAVTVTPQRVTSGIIVLTWVVYVCLFEIDITVSTQAWLHRLGSVAELDRKVRWSEPRTVSYLGNSVGNH
jgi:hypothetical protein